MAPKAKKFTRYIEAQKSSLPKDKTEVNRKESVYVLSNKPRGKRRNQPAWRRRGGGSAKEDHGYMVVTQETRPQALHRPVLTPSQLDVICYDASKVPPTQQQFHMEGTDIAPSIRGLRLSVCVENTRFQLIAKVARHMGFQHVPQHRLWNIQWCDYTPHQEMLRSMKRFQQINHFPGMIEICRKDLLSRNLNRMLKLFPGDYRIFPKTWLMPTDAYDVTIYASKHKRTFILKPYSAGQGRGIWITTDLRTVAKREKLICQTYIERPLLIDGFKFDLRVYTLITSVDPLRIFVYNEGLARFATQKYVTPNLGNSNNVYMHLTNYCLNRRNSQYMVGNGPEGGSKRKLSAFNKWLMDHNYDVAEFWASVDDAIIKTVISAWPSLKHNYNICFPKHDKIQGSFQLLGFDILVDWKLKPYILEVNHTPSLCADEAVDLEVKRPLIRDTLNMLCSPLVDKEQIIRDDRIEHRTKLLRKMYNKKSATESAPSREEGGHEVRQACSIGALTQQIAWEESHLGNYRRIMPPRESEKVQYYCKFYDQSKSALFADTLTSRQREALNHQAKQAQQNQTKPLQKDQPQQKPIPPATRLFRRPDAAQEARRRREEAEAQARKHRAVIAREIQSQKEKLLVPVGKQPVVVRREKHRKYSSKRSSSINKSHRHRKHHRPQSHRVRQQRMLELEAQQDAKFLEQHAKKQRLVGGRGLRGSSQAPPPSSKSHLSLKIAGKQSAKQSATQTAKQSATQSAKKRKRRPRTNSNSLQAKAKSQQPAQLPPEPAESGSSSSLQPAEPSIDWTADNISEMERAEHLNWRKERTNQFNDTRVREMIFSKMYENGHLTKNDIKCFPDLLYNILCSDIKEPFSQ